MTPGPGDDVTVNFNPDGIALVTNATGDFVPPFTSSAPPPRQTFITPSTGVFDYLSGNVDEGIYTLRSDLSFQFVATPVVPGFSISGNPTNLTIYAGTYFAYTFDPDLQSYQFDISALTPDTVPIPTVTGIGEVVDVISGSFQFSDTADVPEPTDGSYRIQVAVARPGSPVPGPLPILGAGLAFGYSRKLRNRVKLSMNS